MAVDLPVIKAVFWTNFRRQVIAPGGLSRAAVALAMLVTGCLISATTKADLLIGFGDSITQGSPYNLIAPNGGRYGGYIPHLEAQIDRNEPSVVENWGISGTTTVEGVMRLPGLLQLRSPDWLLIMYGTNDLWGEVSVPSTMANLRFMIDFARSRGAEPVLSNLLPSSVFPHPGHLVPTVYNPQIKAVALEKQVYFNDVYPRFSANWPILNRDGLHPNLAGYELLATSWCETLPICNDDAKPPISPPGSGLSDNYPWLDILLLD